MNKPLLSGAISAALLSLSLNAWAADPPSPSTRAPDSGPASMKPERVDPAAQRAPTSPPTRTQQQMERTNPATAAPDSGPATMKPERVERDAHRAATSPNRGAADINRRNPATAAPDSGPDSVKPDRGIPERQSTRPPLPGERNVR